MSDDPNAVYAPESTQEGQPVQPEQKQPEYVTKEVLRTELDEFWKNVQKFTGKQESRIAKKLEEWEAKVQDQGIQVTPEMRKTATDRIALSMLEDEGQAQTNPPANDLAAKVIARRMQIAQDNGGELTPDDDEYWEVNFTPDPRDPDGSKFLKTYEKKLKERNERKTASQLPPNPARAPGPSGAPSGDQEQQLTERLNYIQRVDPWGGDPALKKEREEINGKMRQLGR